MATAQHTPGPWSRGKNGDNCGDGLAIIGPDGCEVVAKVYGKGYPIGQGYHPVSEADAALIAAAPAMLAALRQLVEANYGQPSGVTVLALDPARAILAAIDGED